MFTNTHTHIKFILLWLVCFCRSYAFLYDGGSVVLVVLLFGASGTCGAELQAAAHLQDGHTGGHTHTWDRKPAIIFKEVDQTGIDIRSTSYETTNGIVLKLRL